MSHFIEKRDDGSVALFIDGDLQFDSRDERIYHEALTLPALALASRRKDQIRVLIIGGGDGLTARELLKDPSVVRIDLVDYDDAIVTLARTEFAAINNGSMDNPKMNVHVADAWKFVNDAVEQGLLFDLIISDLTVAADVDSARFHSIEWYELLNKLLGQDGVVSVNGVSPQATPRAFWSIFNSMLAAQLHARPYAITLPSFRARGYGRDWGFLLAGTHPIAQSEFERVVLAQPRTTLIDTTAAYRLFALPEELFNYQSTAAPARAGSDILLHYFRNDSSIESETQGARNSFSLDTTSMTFPEPEAGTYLLPPELRNALAECVHSTTNSSEQTGDAPLVTRVLDLMPALHQFHTPEIIADFVDRPAAFLQSIDIAGLVQRLLQRAAELPAQLVEELRYLNEKLAEWKGDYLSLATVGERIITVLTLVVVVANLMYPDSVYAKGDHGGGGGAHHGGDGHGGRGGDGRGRGGDGRDHAAGRNGDRARGFDRGFDGFRRNGFADEGRGWGGYRGYWGHHWGAYGWARPWHGYYWGGYVPPVYVGANNWPNVNVSNNEYVDESGTNYPARNYNYSYVNNYGTGGGAQNAPSQNAAPQGPQAASFKLADGADVLPNGNLAVPLTDQAYLMVTPQATQVVDQNSGNSIVALANDPALVYQAAVEMKRQHHRLQQLIQRAKNGDANISDERLARMQSNVQLLATALQNLGDVPQNPAGHDQAQPLIPGGVEVFAGVWMTPDGKYLAIKRANGNIAYMDRNGWYRDHGRTKLRTPYPAELRTIAVAFLSKMVSDADATANMMNQDQNEGQQHLDMLNRELADYQSPNGQPSDMVQFGSRQIQRSEAIRLTQLAIARTQNKLDELQQQISNMPHETQLAKQEISNLGGTM